MQKSISKILAITFSIAILFTACSKAPNKILPKKDGLWSLNYNRIEKVGSINSGNLTIPYTATFNDDGTGTLTSGITNLSFSWSYDKKNKTITFMTAGSTSKTLNVEEMESKSEKWTYHTATTSGSGVVTTIDEIWTLTKI